MRRVQMLQHISGGRGDGTDWPEAGGIIELGETEAAEVVAAGLGRYAPEEERAVVPDDDVEQRAPAPKRSASRKQA